MIDKCDDACEGEIAQDLRELLAPLQHVDCYVAPPVGLADRTIAAVRQESVLLAQSSSELAPSRRNGTWHSRLDVAVAACLLILLSSLGFGALNRLKLSHIQIACKNNLMQLYADLGTYASLHDGRFPELGDRRLPAGAFVDILVREGFLSSRGVVSCPGVRSEEPLTANHIDYAYSLGSRGVDGQIHGPTSNDDPNTTPLLGDRPLPSWVPKGAGGNHSGGANILFVNGSVRFCTLPTVGCNGDHVYLNDDHQVAAGLHARDAVLGLQYDRP